MASFKQGDRVRIVTRAVTAEDNKTGLYFPHYAGLPGTIRHVYPEGEAAVEIDPEALPAEVRSRHNAIRDQMKTKWLEGLSEEGRSRLTEREKDFRLRYVILVALSDLQKETGAAVRTETKPASEPAASEAEPAPRRPTSEDLSKAEEEELERRRQRRNQ